MKWRYLSFNISLLALLGPSSHCQGPKAVSCRAEIRIIKWSSWLDVRRQGPAIINELPDLLRGSSWVRGIQEAQSWHKQLVRSEPQSKSPKCSLSAELEHSKEIFKPNCLRQGNASPHPCWEAAGSVAYEDAWQSKLCCEQSMKTEGFYYLQCSMTMSDNIEMAGSLLEIK